MVEVLNRRNKLGRAESTVYVGRPTKWGNPLTLRRDTDEDRIEVIGRYIDYLRTQPELVRAMRSELAGRDLACWCAPKRCHAEVIAAIANGRKIRMSDGSVL